MSEAMGGRGVWKGVAAVALLAVAAALGYWLGARHASTPEPVPEPTNIDQPSVTEPEPSPAKEIILVSAAGALRNPGQYTLEAGSRVQHLIEAAGGLADDADLSDINPAARLVDGSALTVPRRAGAAEDPMARPAAAMNPPEYTRSGWRAPAGSPGNNSSGGGRINLNTASQAELETLPGVGPITAQKIIDYREATPFRVVDDLTNIHGVGEKTLETLRPLVGV